MGTFCESSTDIYQNIWLESDANTQGGPDVLNKTTKRCEGVQEGCVCRHIGKINKADGVRWRMEANFVSIYKLPSYSITNISHRYNKTP